jgi:hypothetical protein
MSFRKLEGEGFIPISSSLFPSKKRRADLNEISLQGIEERNKDKSPTRCSTRKRKPVQRFGEGKNCPYP